MNLWGNDGGLIALGFLPFVKLPTNTDGLGNRSVEGSVLLPLAVKLPADFDMGMETGVRFLRNETGRSYDAELLNSVTFGHVLVGKLSGYAEFFSGVSIESGPRWIGTIDFGLTYAIAGNMQLDCGCNAGVTRSADDLNVFSGITVRF